MNDELEIRTYRPEDEDALVTLWRECGLVVSANDPRRDIARKLAVDPEGLLVGEEGGRIVATVMFGHEGHRGWINYLAVAPDVRGARTGRAMMAEAQRRLATRSCPKINLQVRRGNEQVLAFYRAIGFRFDDVVSMGKPLVRDDQD